MNKIIILFAIYVFTSACVSRDAGETSSDYQMMDKALHWLAGQDVRGCDEPLEMIFIETNTFGELIITGRGYGDDYHKFIYKVFPIADLPDVEIFNCADISSNAIQINKSGSTTFNQMVQIALSKWRNPECSKIIQEYYVSSAVDFSKPRLPYRISVMVTGRKKPFHLFVTRALHYRLAAC